MGSMSLNFYDLRGNKMKRRKFLGVLGAAGLGAGLPKLNLAELAKTSPCIAPQDGTQLAGMSPRELRDSLHTELFDVVLPFWDKHGVDHEYGGVMCSLDYDGTLVNTDKLLWFQGRALWVYSYLYNHFGQDPRHLEIARKTKDFVLKYGRQEDGWWAEKLGREGKILTPFSGDIDGPYFIAEGLQEYAVAAKDEQTREMAIELFIKLCRYFNRPEYRYSGPDFPELKPNGSCVRPQGTWMMNLSVGTEILQHGKNVEVESIVDRALDAIIHRHYNPEIGLNTEMLYYDFTRPEGLERKVRLGHGIEIFWMAMDEAERGAGAELTSLMRSHSGVVRTGHLEPGQPHWASK